MAFPGRGTAGTRAYLQSSARGPACRRQGPEIHINGGGPPFVFYGSLGRRTRAQDRSHAHNEARERLYVQAPRRCAPTTTAPTISAVTTPRIASTRDHCRLASLAGGRRGGAGGFLFLILFPFTNVLKSLRVSVASTRHVFLGLE
jgi:hypothetical protein